MADAEKVKKALRALLKLQENKFCADCPIKGPTWASINLGVFLCLQCSGIHRNLGVHISKVRSTELDTWQMEWYEVMKKIGNERGNEYWEARLPKNFSGKPTAEEAEALSYKMKKFITDKYEKKLWVPKEGESAGSKKKKKSSRAVSESDSDSDSSSSSSSSSSTSSSSSSSSEDARKKKKKSSTTKKKKSSKGDLQKPAPAPAPPVAPLTNPKADDAELDLFGDFVGTPQGVDQLGNTFGAMSMGPGQPPVAQPQQSQQHQIPAPAQPQQPQKAGIDLTALYQQGSGAGTTYGRGNGLPYGMPQQQQYHNMQPQQQYPNQQMFMQQQQPQQQQPSAGQQHFQNQYGQVNQFHGMQGNQGYQQNNQMQQMQRGGMMPMPMGNNSAPHMGMPQQQAQQQAQFSQGQHGGNSMNWNQMPMGYPQQQQPNQQMRPQQQQPNQFQQHQQSQQMNQFQQQPPKQNGASFDPFSSIMG